MFQKSKILFTIVSVLLIVAVTTLAQKDTTPKKKLRSPAVINGNIGGESHDSYVIRVQKGKLMTVEISWVPEGENTASFSVSQSPNFFSSSPVKFGRESENGKRWTGRIPRTGNYYIYVVAHPIADYKLKVSVR